MRLGIDTSTLNGGGSFTHLREVLAAVSPERHGFSRVTVWGSKAALAVLPAGKPWLVALHEPMFPTWPCRGMFFPSMPPSGAATECR